MQRRLKKCRQLLLIIRGSVNEILKAMRFSATSGVSFYLILFSFSCS